jgi:hypothetical protein
MIDLSKIICNQKIDAMIKLLKYLKLCKQWAGSLDKIIASKSKVYVCGSVSYLTILPRAIHQGKKTTRWLCSRRLGAWHYPAKNEFTIKYLSIYYTQK